MDLASTLIRRVARAFYETRHILVIDSLFIHSVYGPPPLPLSLVANINFGRSGIGSWGNADRLYSLHAEDLAHLLGMQQKDIRKLCGRLREDRMIAVYAY